MTTVGLISPGKMGASVGAAAIGNGHRVIWAGKGRSKASQDRADQIGLEDCGTIAEMASQAEMILSVCPPHDAVPVAQSVAESGFAGLFSDCNAIAPHKSRQIDSFFEGDNFVDGGIIGGPAWSADSGTRLYLSGDRASDIAALFISSPLHAEVIPGGIGAASALKMTFAAYTKGTTALLTAILAVSEAEGVREALERQWGEAFTRQTHQRVTGNAEKAWRFAGEMREIAETFESAGQPPGFHQAAADLFEKLAEFKDQPQPDIQQLLAELLGRRH